VGVPCSDKGNKDFSLDAANKRLKDLPQDSLEFKTLQTLCKDGNWEALAGGTKGSENVTLEELHAAENNYDIMCKVQLKDSNGG